MTVWSLTTDTEDGISVDLYLNELQAYEALVRDWFPQSSQLLKNRFHREATAALERGIPELKEWLSKYLDYQHSSLDCDYLDSYLVTQHEHPWTFGPVAEDERFAKLRAYLAESDSSVVNVRAVLDIIDGEPELCECGRKYRECIAYENGDDFQHGDH